MDFENDDAPKPRYSKSRKGIEGYGRPRKYGVKTKTMRVPEHITTDDVMAIDDAKRLLSEWRDYAYDPARGTAVRADYLRRLLADFEALGW